MIFYLIVTDSLIIIPNWPVCLFYKERDANPKGMSARFGLASMPLTLITAY